MTRLHQLYTEGGQSPWIDNLSRDSIRTGRLANMLDDGIRGVTSNPTIFQKAMTSSDVYSADFARLIESSSVEQAFWEMATADVTGALEIFHPLYEQSGASDGFVSLEVSPRLAYDTEGTIKDARAFHERIAMPNLLVKIPATEAGVPAIRQMISEGRNINVTLIFSLERYSDVIEAYLSGLEALGAAGGDISRVHSVASFFVSRVDTEVDRRLEAVGTRQALPFVVKPPWRKPSWPTSCSPIASWAPAGKPCVPMAPTLSGRSGPPRRPRTLRTQISLRRQPRRSGHRQHDARRHHRCVRRPRHSGPDRRPRA